MALILMTVMPSFSPTVLAGHKGQGARFRARSTRGIASQQAHSVSLLSA